jgi:hypothetical protein
MLTKSSPIGKKSSLRYSSRSSPLASTTSRRKMKNERKEKRYSLFINHYSLIRREEKVKPKNLYG